MAMATIWYYMATKWYFLLFHLKRLFIKYLNILSEKNKCCYAEQLSFSECRHFLLRLWWHVTRKLNRQKFAATNWSVYPTYNLMLPLKITDMRVLTFVTNHCSPNVRCDMRPLPFICFKQHVDTAVDTSRLISKRHTAYHRSNTVVHLSRKQSIFTGPCIR